MESKTIGGQYGKQNPLFMYQGTIGYSVRAVLAAKRDGESAAQPFNAVPPQSGPNRCGTMP